MSQTTPYPAASAGSIAVLSGDVTARSPRGLRASRNRRLQLFRVVVLLLASAFFLVPFLAMVEFSTRGTGVDAARTLDAWRRIATYPNLISAIITSLELSVLTSVASLALMVPTMIWVRLRLPRINRLVEFVCLLPLTIPAIVLVVGLVPVYAWVNYLSPGPLKGSSLVLTFAYIVLVLPYVYRALDAGLRAIDVQTLAEAARSLGAGWPTVMFRVVGPNMSAAILNAAVLCVALVMGEFTVASLLNYVNLQYELNNLGQADASVSVAVAVGFQLFVVALLVGLSFIGRRRGSKEA
ncbi:ABC transporter permease [Kineosporia sp. R_H_3]|uniref:ABC transporter permease n=1 Tax=Kineosporia sp. R_H_3 TaxID=1961848 RepID=UPI000B4A5FE8|nr:ABC transporter permease subunit [Kineosporia sp. R_H_3]